MTALEQTELMIRAAQLGRAVLQLVGVKDKTLAKRFLPGLFEQLTALDEFVESTEKRP